MRDLAELALLDDSVARLDQMRRAPALRADLHHALVLAGRGQHRLAFRNVHADRLLHVDIHARFTAAIIGSACQWSGVPIRQMSRSFSFSISR